MSEEGKKQTEETESKISGENISRIIDLAVKSSAALLGTVYVCGFFTLNSHLYEHSVVNLGIARADYLTAGASFALFIVTYALLGGRGIVLRKQWLDKERDRLKKRCAPQISALLARIHSFIQLAFLHCLSAAFFSDVAFRPSEISGVSGVLLAAFLISYSLRDISNYAVKRPFAHLIIDSILKLLTIIAFFLLVSSFKPITILITFITFSAYIKLVLDGFERYGITTDRLVYSVAYSGLFFLLAAISFGAVVYGDVSRKLGGGESLSVEIALDRRSVGFMENQIKEVLHGNVVFSTSTEIYVNVEDETIALPRRSVLWMRFPSPEDDSPLLQIGTDPTADEGSSPLPTPPVE